MGNAGTTGGLTPAGFIAKWSRVTLPERAASQEHFIDLCRLLGQPTPAEHDATGAEYTFEKGVAVTGGASRGAKGDSGFADVWWRNKFAWEYKRKGKYKDLADAYRQLLQYREALGNPPLLVVCDIARTQIHTNFTGTIKQVHEVLLADLDKPESLSLLRRIFTDPASFCPTVTVEKVTEEVAKQIGALAVSLQERGHAPHDAARFLMKVMFCLFAEDVNLLPAKLLTRLLRQWHDNGKQLTGVLTDLFAKMATGGAFGVERIAWFNGGLFDGKDGALELTYDEIGQLLVAAAQDWGGVEPAIFGTLFERSLDPSKRAQIGAHYTSRDDIMLIVEPVVMAPLRRQWADAQAEVEKQLERRRAATTPATKKKADQAIADQLVGFLDRLSKVRILDPACGSGNFLYVAIQELLNLEKRVITYAARADIGLGLLPTVRPTQLHGIEINPYAAELAQVVIWIGYLQWMRDNGFNTPRDPILEPLKTIENRDAILDLSDPQHPAPAHWPQADFIIGNPPFLGGGLLRRSLGDEYVESLFKAYDLPRFSDLCCYWYELARRAVTTPQHARAGLLATQAIRGGVNREVLSRIKRDAHVFMAWADRDWVLNGAAVHVSMVGFSCDKETPTLNGNTVTDIHDDLTTGLECSPVVLRENEGIQHEGDKKGGDFEIRWDHARKLLSSPHLAEASAGSVVRPWFNGKELNDRLQGMWIIDFPPGTTMTDAAKFQDTFKHVEDVVGQKYRQKRTNWWIHERPRPAMRAAISNLPRYVVTTRHSKHRIFGWALPASLPDSAMIVFARSDDYFFGVLHSSIHELWARRMGTQLREVESGFRYTPTTCFETFRLPWPPASQIENRKSQIENLQRAIAEAASELNELRERWLNPPEWIEPIAAAVDARDDFHDVPAEARGLIRQSAIMAAAAADANLKRRTLTNLYNERPTWLKLAHQKLDQAVLAAYAAIDPEGGWSADWADVWFDTGAGQPLPADHPLTARRAEIDQRVIANLLRLNGAER